MRLKKTTYFIVLLLIIFTISACSNKNTRKEISDLTKSEIESILSICHDDTLMVLGTFIHFQPESYVSEHVGQYLYVAEMLNRPFENYSDVDSMREIVHELYKKNRTTDESMIAIPPTFIPNIKITNKIRTTDLQVFLVSDITEHNIEKIYRKESSSEMMLDYFFQEIKKGESKFVSDKTNLAKVFYLQDKAEFIKRNGFYYYMVRRKFMEEQIEQIKKEKEADAQSSWDDYL